MQRQQVCGHLSGQRYNAAHEPQPYSLLMAGKSKVGSQSCLCWPYLGDTLSSTIRRRVEGVCISVPHLLVVAVRLKLILPKIALYQLWHNLHSTQGWLTS